MGRSEEPIKVETCYCSAVSSSGAAQLVNCFLVSTQDCVPVNVFFGGDYSTAGVHSKRINS